MVYLLGGFYSRSEAVTDVSADRVVGACRGLLSTVTYPSCSGRRRLGHEVARCAAQAAQPHQVVGRRDQVPGQPRAIKSAIAGASEPANGLHPAEDLFDPLPDPLTDRVARVASGPPVDRTPPIGVVLGHVRGDLPLPQASATQSLVS